MNSDQLNREHTTCDVIMSHDSSRTKEYSPEAEIVDPVTHRAESEHKKATISEISPTLPTRPSAGVLQSCQM